MGKFVTLNPSELKELRQVDERLVSYNVEMTEVTGGTFWKAYTEAQVDGTEEFPVIKDWTNMGNLQQWYDPIDTTNPRLIKLAKELGTAWIRVSGTWANKTYYDFDGHTNGQVPAGYQNVLTKQQWTNLLDFVKAVDGKLLVSFANCPGNHSKDEPWDTTQAKMLMDYSIEYGVPVAAAEFTNEPNLIQLSGLPHGYTAADHARDHDAFGAWLKENYPDCLFVGPCTVGDIDMFGAGMDGAGGGMAAGYEIVTTEALLGEYKSKMDVFSYHYYNGVSERGAAMGGHWPYEAILTEQYLGIAAHCARQYVPKRDKYVPGGQMWVTESGDAGCGGNTWASTYADVPRTLNELGEFTTVTDGVIFHNTLASSDYGFLKHGTFVPRPNYFAVLLWNRIMGATVYDCGAVSEGAHVYAHSRKDGKDGVAYLIVNNSNETTTVELPSEADIYMLAGETGLRSRKMTLNGKALALGENDELPALEPVKASGTLEIPATNCVFIVLEAAEPAVEIEPLFEECVDFETFSKSDFRAVKVKECSAVKKSKKLLHFVLDDGSGKDRIILSGIRAFYEPEELVGKTLLAITNLPPRAMMGIESCGMLMSAIHTVGGEEKLNLIMLDDAIPAGAKLY